MAALLVVNRILYLFEGSQAKDHVAYFLPTSNKNENQTFIGLLELSKYEYVICKRIIDDPYLHAGFLGRP